MRYASTDVTTPHQDVLIADAVRSPLGTPRPGSTLARISPATLLAQCASALLERTLLESTAVTKVLISGGSRCEPIAHEASRLIGLSPAVTIGSAGSRHGSVIHRGAHEVGPKDVVLVLGASGPVRQDSAPPRRVLDGELVASRWHLGPDELDAYARMSRERAREVAAMGEFAPEIVPAVAWSEKSCCVVTQDEVIEETGARQASAGAGHRLLHAGVISRPAVGAAATVLVGHDRAMELGIRPRARIIATAQAIDDPYARGCGSIRASQELLVRTGVDVNDLDHYEVSERSAAVPLAWQRELGADINRFNPRGGALGLGDLGHASSLRSLATTLSALHATGGRLAIHASDDGSHAGAALLLEYLHRPCCSREVLGGPFCRRTEVPLLSHP